MRLTHIQNGVVINISEGDLVTTQQMFPDQIIREAGDEQKGYIWDGVSFTPPTPPVVNRSSYITRLAFRNRFTNAEKVSLYTAANTNVQVKIYLDDINTATYIDLSRPDTIEGVTFLETVGLIGAGRASEILNAPITEKEVWRSNF